MVINYTYLFPLSSFFPKNFCFSGRQIAKAFSASFRAPNDKKYFSTIFSCENYGYFPPGIRHLTAFMAGASKFKLAEFGLFSYTGALIWSVAFVTAGYFLGEEWSRVTGKIRFALIIASVGVLATLVVYFLVRRRRGL